MTARRPTAPPDCAALLTTAQVASVLQLSERAVRRIPAECLPWLKIGRCRRYRRVDVNGYVIGLAR